MHSLHVAAGYLHQCAALQTEDDDMRVNNKIRFQQIEILEKTYLGARPALNFRNPFELLIAVILSAQCTDKRVNVVTERLFKRVNTPEDMIHMGQSELESEIREGLCFGVLANMEFILVCTYEKDGENPELILYRKR